MKKFLVVILGLCSLHAMADNQRGFYAGGGINVIEDEKDSSTKTSSVRAGEVFGGYKYNAALGAELRIGRGAGAGDYKEYTNGAFTGTKIEREVGNYASVYYKPELINDEAKLYGLLGFTQIDTTYSTFLVNTEGETLQSEIEESETGYSYGVGVGFILNSHVNLNIEWKNICDELDNSFNSTSVNLDYRF